MAKKAAKPEAKKAAKPSAAERAALAAELRKYVRADGGYRSGLTDAEQKRGEEVAKKLGLEEVKWPE